jgi:hypothetical protein
MPVQPMKAAGGIATRQAAQTLVITPTMVWGASLATGIIWLLLGVTGTARHVAKFISRGGPRDHSRSRVRFHDRRCHGRPSVPPSRRRPRPCRSSTVSRQTNTPAEANSIKLSMPEARRAKLSASTAEPIATATSITIHPSVMYSIRNAFRTRMLSSFRFALGQSLSHPY